MSKTKKLLYTLFCTVFILSSFLCLRSFTKKTYAQAEALKMYGDTFTESEDNGDTVYTAAQSTAQQTLTPENNALGNANVITFQVKPNEYHPEEESTLGLMVDLNDGYSFYYEIVPYWRAVRLRLYQGANCLYDLDTPKNYSAQNTEWLTVRCVALKNSISITVNDEVTLSSDSREHSFKNATLRFNCQSSAPSFKNVFLTQENLTVPTMAGSVLGITEENGETVYSSTAQDGNLNGLYYGPSVTNENMFSFDLRYNAFGGEAGEGEAERNVQLYINVGSGVQLAFQFLPRWKAVRIKLLNNGSVVQTYAETNYPVPDGYTSSDWLNFHCTFMKGYASIKCGNTVIAKAVLDEKYEFSNSDLYFTCWNVAPSFKNLSLSSNGVLPKASWTGSEYSESDGVYTATQNENLKQLVRSQNTGEANAITFKVKANNYFPDTANKDGNAGFIVFTNQSNEAYLFFELIPQTSTARIRIIAGNNAILIGQHSYVGSINEWLTVKCIFNEDFIVMFINDQLVISSFNSHGYTFNAVKCCMSAWKTAPSFSDMTLLSEEKDYVNAGYMDLDFTDMRGVQAISSVNAQLSYNSTSKTVDFSVNAENPIISVRTAQLAGGRYSAYLPVRNTILVRLKNNTNAQSVTLTVLSSTNGTYEKTFAVQKSQDYQTYYFNISDKNPDGYLKNASFKFNGIDSGEISVKAISFEREDAIYDFAQEGNLSCVADLKTKTVTVSGKLKEEHAGKEVFVVVSDVTNYKEVLSGKRLGSTTSSSDGTFKVVFSLESSNTATLLATRFLAYVQDYNSSTNVKLSHAFAIENYYDFYENPYKATIPENCSVTVTDAQFGAKGDGYTDDTDAIQNAINYVHSQGGGKVIIPGNDSDYGKRYIATNIVLKDNVELHVEKNAVIWQSPRKSDYKYTPVYGHDVTGTAMWAHAGVCANYPLIQITNCSNVRITGGGTLRMMDDGNEWLDGTQAYVNGYNNTNIIVGCENRIHLTPIGLFNSHNVEISNIKIKRGGSWHIVAISCSELYIANVDISEAICLNTDGFSLQNTSNVVLLRNFLVSNDDAIVLLPVYRDNRDKEDFWWGRIKGESNCVSNIKIVGNNLYGGLGLTFIPWGSESPDLSNAEIKDIEAYDNIFNGGQSIGAWADNPNYGTSAGANYEGLSDNSETDDYSPIKDVYLHDNYYPSTTGLYHTPNAKHLFATATNFVNDAGLITATDFINSSFERELRYDNETTFVSGLSYWSYELDKTATAGTESIGTKIKTAKNTGNSFTVSDYAGFVQGKGTVYQGIYLTKGWYRVSASIKNVSGNSTFIVGKTYVKNSDGTLSKLNVLSNKAIANSNDFTLSSYVFYVDLDGVYALGISNTNDEKVYFDDFTLENDVTSAEKIEATKQERSKLQLKVNETKTLLQNGEYTDESVENVNSLLHDAEVALLRETVLASELNKIFDDLVRAVEKLEVKNPSTSESSSSNSSQTAPDSTESSSDDFSPTTSNSSATKKSGCSSSISSFPVCILLLSLAALAFISIKKKK